MDKSLIPSAIILILINITDSITNSIITPSLIFYVLAMGGTLHNYGVIMSSSFLSGIAMMNFYGAWVDANGNKYKLPYCAAFGFGILGSLIYFIAIVLPSGRVAVGAILVARLITGLGASGRTLAYSWVATAVPREGQRTLLTLLSMSRTLGMMLGPLMNLWIVKIDTELRLGGFVIPVTPNNSVGLVLAVAECILFVATFLFLKDPPPKGTIIANGKPTPRAGLRDVLMAWTHFDLFFCVFIMFTVMFNFTFYTTAIPPIAANMYNWGPVQISNILAAQAVVLFLGMVASMFISMSKAPDILLIGFGNLCFIIGGLTTYLFWTTEATPVQFLIPIFIVSLSFPFIGPANRSKFTKAVHSRPELEHSHGIMQSIFNQSFQIGGLFSPYFTTSFILKSSSDIDQSGTAHELSMWAFVIPISSAIMLLGLLYEEIVLGENGLGLFEVEIEPEEEPVTEKTRLSVSVKKRKSSKRRRSSVVEIEQNFSRQYEVDRRCSVEANGIINPFETRDEIALRSSLLEDKKAWEELVRLGDSIEERDEEDD